MKLVTENFRLFCQYMILLHSQTHIPSGLSGSVSRMATGAGEGTVGVGVGAIKELLHTISVYTSMPACIVYAYPLCFSLLP